MNRKYALIREFSDGRWHSGENLAAALGVSRAAVWKRLKSLEALGLAFESQAGKGYRLRQPIELLDVDSIRGALATAASPQLEVLSEIDSTNRYLGDAAAAEERQAPAICFAEHQTAGRGRRGRQWQSPFGANLYCSLLWRFEIMPSALPALSLAVGVAVAESLRELGFVGIGLKWPNDLLVDGRKLGGILIEHRGEMGGACQVIVGLGLNYAMQIDQAAGVDQPWVSLMQLAKAQGVELPSRNLLAARITDALICCLQCYTEAGFAAFQPRWAQFDLAQGRMIRLEQEGDWQPAEALGVDHDGALLVRVRGERRRFMSGDISLRLTEDS